MNNHGNPLAIVVDLDGSLLAADVDPDAVHTPIPLVVICRIHQHLIEDLVQRWHILNLFQIKAHLVLGQHVAMAGLLLNAAHVGVWPE